MNVKDILDKEVLDVIKEMYSEIFSAEKKVADFILENPQKAIESNVSELAKLSGVSDATVVRMCHHIGYKGYYQFRITLARDLGKRQQEKPELTKAQGGVEKVFKLYADNIANIGTVIDDDTMWKCIKLIKECGTVHLIAMGNTIPLTQYMQFRLGRLGIKSTSGLSPEYYMNNINLANPKDVVVAVSKSGTSRPVISGLELAKQKGLKRIAITSNTQSAASKLSNCTLVSIDKDNSLNYYNDHAHTSLMVTIDVLLDFLMNEEIIKNKHADIPELILSEYKL